MDTLIDSLEASLPIQAEGLRIRQLSRPDMDCLSTWPKYPWPYDVFRFSFCGLSAAEMDRAFKERTQTKTRFTLVVDADEVPAIGYVTLVQIDWARRRTENMSLRIHPEFCGQGLGTRVMMMVRDWWLGHGMKAMRFDVAATNHRAVRCYLKAGFVRTGEFWRDAPDLIGKDLSEEKYRFLGNDVDRESGTPRLRFYWMQIEGGQSAPREPWPIGVSP